MTEQRLTFICELYQLVEYIRAHPCSELNIPQSDVGRQIATVVNALPSLTTPSTHRKRSRTETDPSTSRAPSTSRMQVNDLEAIGFVPVWEADGDGLMPFAHVRSSACVPDHWLNNSCFSFRAIFTLCDELDEERHLS